MIAAPARRPRTANEKVRYSLAQLLCADQQHVQQSE